jgi:hypothetical protein
VDRFGTGQLRVQMHASRRTLLQRCPALLISDLTAAKAYGLKVAELNFSWLHGTPYFDELSLAASK